MVKTIGITDVACLNAGTAVPNVTMTSTLSRTNSVAISAYRSMRFSAQRCSIATVRPSIQPSSRSLSKSAAHLQGLNFYPQCPTRGLRFLEHERGIRIGRIPKYRHASKPRHNLFQQFEPLPAQVRRHEAHPRDVAAGSRQTGNEPAPQWIASGSHDDWNGGSGLLGRQRCKSSGCRNNIDLETDQVRCEFRQSFEPIFRKAGLETDVPPFDPSQLPQ